MAAADLGNLYIKMLTDYDICRNTTLKPFLIPVANDPCHNVPIEAIEATGSLNVHKRPASNDYGDRAPKRCCLPIIDFETIYDVCSFRYYLYGSINTSDLFV